MMFKANSIIIKKSSKEAPPPLHKPLANSLTLSFFQLSQL